MDLFLNGINEERDTIGSPLLSLGGENPKCIYLDWNATTPIFPSVSRAMLPFVSQCFGNPSSSNPFSQPCKEAIDRSRSHVAKLLGCSASDIVFTSCGSESNNQAIHIALESWWYNKDTAKFSPPQVVTTNVEHPATLECLKVHERNGRCKMITIPCERDGRVNPEAVRDAIHSTSTALVTIMHSNNETGVLMPVAEIAKFCNDEGVLFHTDAAQSISKVPVQALPGIDMITVVGHKFGAPKGIAALYIAPVVPDCCPKKPWCNIPSRSSLGALIRGGGQERGWRAGTENVLLISALGEACRLAAEELEACRAHMLSCKEQLLTLLQQCLGKENVRVNGNLDSSLPNTLNVGLKWKGSTLLAGRLLSCLTGRVAASTGSACHTSSDNISISPVLQAMGVPRDWALGSLRLSVGRHTTLNDIASAVVAISEELPNSIYEK